MNFQQSGQAAQPLDAPLVVAIMAGHDETVRADQIGFYPSLEALAEKVRSSRNWTEGATFACDLADGRYVVMRQIAPASCEMMTVSQNGVHDTLTAYRYSQDELVQQLQEYCGERQAVPVTDDERMQQIGAELARIEREGVEMARREASPREIADLNVRRAMLRTERSGIVWRRTQSAAPAAGPTCGDIAGN